MLGGVAEYRGKVYRLVRGGNVLASAPHLRLKKPFLGSAGGAAASTAAAVGAVMGAGAGAAAGGAGAAGGAAARLTAGAGAEADADAPAGDSATVLPVADCSSASSSTTTPSLPPPNQALHLPFFCCFDPGALAGSPICTTVASAPTTAPVPCRRSLASAAWAVAPVVRACSSSAF